MIVFFLFFFAINLLMGIPILCKLSFIQCIQSSLSDLPIHQKSKTVNPYVKMMKVGECNVPVSMMLRNGTPHHPTHPYHVGWVLPSTHPTAKRVSRWAPNT